MRAFISIDIPEEMRKEIIKIQRSLPKFFGKKTAPENLHLTLKFLGEINEEQLSVIKKRLSKLSFSSFETEIDFLGFFDNYPRGIVWLHLTNCEQFQKEIDDALKDLFGKEKRFMSHLTIA